MITIEEHFWHIQLPDYTLSIDLDTEMLREPKEDPQAQHGDPSNSKYKELELYATKHRKD